MAAKKMNNGKTPPKGKSQTASTRKASLEKENKKMQKMADEASKQGYIVSTYTDERGQLFYRALKSKALKDKLKKQQTMPKGKQ
jgi:hypothetical protein